MADAAAAQAWVATPTHLLRWDCVQALTADWVPGRFLELGAGQGDFTARFVERGFSGACFDVEEPTRAALRARLAGYRDRVQVVADLDALDAAAFDYLFAFEVLEHIEDAAGALSGWARCLRPGGRALVSVPAHMRKYGPEDRYVGHVRRYERAELHALLQGAGFVDIRIANYGFPLANATRVARTLLTRPERDVQGASAHARSVASGTRRSPFVMALAPWIQDAWVQPFCRVQRAFFARDLGDGLVATARLPG